MEDFHSLSNRISDLQKDIFAVKKQTSVLASDIKEDDKKLEELNNRIKSLFDKAGIDESNMSSESTIEDIQQINTEIDSILFSVNSKTEADKALDVNNVDLLVACLAGGLAVIVDFVLVKVPKTMDIKLNGEKVHCEGSPLTTIFKKIGTTNDGKEAKWIKTLEKWFHVNYDASIKENIPGMYPKNHRVYSLGHDPSILGLIWGIKDIVSGTFSYIDKNGVLHIDKVIESDLKKIFYAPFLWLGHIISDVFTKQGIPRRQVPRTSS